MVLAASLARALTLSLIAVFHLVLLILVGVTFAPHSDGMLLVGFAVTDCIAILVILCFVVHKYYFRDDEPSKKRGRVTFTSLLLISLIGSIIITAHAARNSKDGICDSYNPMPHSCTLSVMTIALSLVVTLTALQGLLIAHFGDLPGVVMVTPAVSQVYPTLSKSDEQQGHENDPKTIRNAYDQWTVVAV